MSIIENKIISMDFDNKKFQKGISETISSLDSFTKKINGLAGGDKIFASLASSVEKIESKFNILHLTAVNVLSDIAMQAIQTGKQLLKSLSLDQITAGFQKFSNITVATSTILSAAPEKTLKEVEAIVERLSLFTDETSYNLETMVNTIGAFVSAGRDLDKSSVTMMGISTWAAEAGANAEQATRAMNQLSQALGRGYIVLQDWQSIQTLKMDTRAVKDQIIQAAEAAGTLKKLEDGIWETNVAGVNKIQVTLDNFSQTITQGRWLTTKVFEDAMSVYGRMAYDLMDLYSALTDDTVEFVESASFSQEAYDKLSEYIESENIVIDTTTDLIKAIRKAGIEVDEYGLKLFENAQVAKTWEDVINSIKDATSTQWSNIFKSVIGNLDEAKAVFTKISERLWDVFAGPINNLSSAFDEWEDLGGRDLLFGEDEDSQGAVWNLVDALSALGEVVQRVIVKLFGDISGENLFGWTEKFRDFTESLILNDRQIESWANTIVDVINVVRNLFSLLKSIGNLLSPLTGGTFSSNLISTIQNITNFYSNAINFILTRTTRLINALARVVRPIVKQIKQAWNDIFGSNIYRSAKKFVDTILNKIISFFDRLRKDKDSLEAIGGTFEAIFGVVRDVYEIFKLVKDEIKDILGLSRDGELYDFVMTIFGYASGLKEYTGKLKDGNEELDKTRSIISDVAGVLKEAFSSIWSIIERIKNAFVSVFFENASLDGFANGIHNASEDAKSFFRLFNMSASGPNAIDGVNEMGDNLEKTFRGIFKAVKMVVKLAANLISVIFDSFSRAFGLDKGKALDDILSFTSNIEDVVDKLGNDSRLIDGLSTVFEGLFSILRGCIDIIMSIFHQVDENIIKKLFGGDGVEIDGVLTGIGKGLISFGDGLSYVAACIAHIDFSSFKAFTDSIKDIFGGRVTRANSKQLDEDLSTVDEAMEVFVKHGDLGTQYASQMASFDEITIFTAVDEMSGHMQMIAEKTSEAADSISEVTLGATVKEVLQDTLNGVADVIKILLGFIGDLLNDKTVKMIVLGYGIKKLYDLVYYIISAFGAVKYVVNEAGDLLWNVGVGVKKYLKRAGTAKILRSVAQIMLAASLMIFTIVGSIVAVTYMFKTSQSEMKSALITIGVITTVVLGLIGALIYFVSKATTELVRGTDVLLDKSGLIFQRNYDAVAERIESIALVLLSASLVIGVIVAALWALTKIIGKTEQDQARFKTAAITMGVIAGALLVFIGAVLGLTALLIHKLDKDKTKYISKTLGGAAEMLKSIGKAVKDISKAMIFMGIAISIVALASKYFGKEEVEQAGIIMGIIAGGLMVLSAGLAAILGWISKGQNVTAKLGMMSVFMASLSLMLFMLGEAMFKISAGMAIIMLATSSLSISYSKEAGWEFSASTSSDPTKTEFFKTVGGYFMGIIAVIGVITALITWASSSIKTIGGGITAAAQILATGLAFNMITLALLQLLGVVVLFMLAVTDVNADGKRVINDDKLITAVIGLMMMIGVIIWATTMLRNMTDGLGRGIDLILGAAAFTIVVATLIGLLEALRALYSVEIPPQMGDIAIVFMALVGVVYAIYKVLEALSKIESPNLIKSAASMAILGGLVGILGGIFIALAALDADWGVVIGIAAGISAVIIILARSLRMVGDMQGDVTKTAAAFVVASSVIAIIGGIIIALSAMGTEWYNSLVYAVSIVGVLIVLAVSLKLFAEALGSNTSDAMKIGIALTIASASILAIGGVFAAIAAFGGTADQILGTALSISIVLGVLSAMLYLLTTQIPDATDLIGSAAALTMAAAALSVLGLVVTEMAKLDQGSVWSASAAVMVMVAVIGLVLGLMSKLSKYGMLAASASIAILLFSLAGAVMMLGFALAQITNSVEPVRLNAVVDALVRVLDVLKWFFFGGIAIAALVAGLSLIKGIGDLIVIGFVSVIAGISMFVFSLSSLVKAIGQAVLNFGSGIDILATGLEKLHKVSFTLNETLVNIRNALGTLKLIIKDILGIIRDTAHEIIKTMAYLITQGIGLIIEVIVSSIETMLQVIDEHKESLAAHIINIITFLASVIADHGEILGKSLTVLVQTAFDIFLKNFNLILRKVSKSIRDAIGNDGLLGDAYEFITGKKITDYKIVTSTIGEAYQAETGKSISRLLKIYDQAANALSPGFKEAKEVLDLAGSRSQTWSSDTFKKMTGMSRGEYLSTLNAYNEFVNGVNESKVLQKYFSELGLPQTDGSIKSIVDTYLGVASVEALKNAMTKEYTEDAYTLLMDSYKKDIKQAYADIKVDATKEGGSILDALFGTVNKKWSELENNPDSALNKIKELFGGGNNGFTIDINANADGLLGAADDATDSIQKIFGDMDMDWGDIFDTDGLVSDTDEAMSALENRHQAYWVKVQQAEADSASGDTTVTNTFYITSNDPEAVGRTINKQLAREKRRADNQW